MIAPVSTLMMNLAPYDSVASDEDDQDSGIASECKFRSSELKTDLGRI